MPAVIKVGLKVEERAELEKLARSNKRTVREKTRVRSLLLSDMNRKEGALKVDEVCQQLRVSAPTVVRVKKAFLARGVASVFHQEQRNRKARVMDGEAEAFVIASVCSEAPEGRKRWTLELLKDKLIATSYVDAISKETIRQVLKKTHLNLG
jgi:Fe2+ or Zn2+ uptake regulation protein